MTPDARPDPRKMSRDDLVAEVVALREHDQHERLRLLADVGVVLAAPLHYRDTLTALTRLVVPALADLCLIDVVDDVGTAHRLAVASVNPAKETELAEALTPPTVVPSASAQARVIATHQPERSDVAPTDDVTEATRRAGIRSMMVVPLVARQRMLGALTFAVTESNRSYTDEDLAFAEEIGRRAAMHLDNARLLELHQRGVEARQQLLNLVSHDLKNPLAAILLNARMLTAPAERGVDAQERTERVLERIMYSAGRMQGLIDDLLDAGGIESGRFTVRTQALDVEGQLLAAVDAMRLAARDRRIQLDVRVGNEALQVFADPARLQQVLANLIGNAVKFTPEGGRVTVAAQGGPDGVKITVADSGPGISPEVLPRVFDRFWQGEGSRRGGAGLGLFIVKGLVDAMGGRVWADSRLGAGARFIFTLPAAPAHAAELPGAPVLDERADSLHVRMPSHALRSALSSLELQLERIQRESPHQLADAQALALRRLDAVKRRLIDLTDDALRQALRAHELARPPEAPTDVRAVVGDVVRSLEADAAARNVELSIDALPDLPPFETNAELLRVGVNALLVHALKPLQRGRVTVHLAVDAAGCRVTVHTPEPPLTAGADLAVASQTAITLGGQVEADATGKRLSMIFRRPRVRSVFRAERPTAERSEVPRVLLVDDDADILDELAHQLREEGYEVEAARSGQEAQRRLRTGTSLPDLILLDLRMPDVNGWQFRDAQLEDPQLATIPVVLLSADGDVKRAAEELAATAWVAKPFELDHLLETVKGLVRRA